MAHLSLDSGALQSPTYPDGTGADTPIDDKRYGTRNHEDALLERNGRQEVNAAIAGPGMTCDFRISNVEDRILDWPVPRESAFIA